MAKLRQLLMCFDSYDMDPKYSSEHLRKMLVMVYDRDLLVMFLPRSSNSSYIVRFTQILDTDESLMTHNDITTFSQL